jgi:hypothetical protein
LFLLQLLCCGLLEAYLEVEPWRLSSCLISCSARVHTVFSLLERQTEAWNVLIPLTFPVQ